MLGTDRARRDGERVPAFMEFTIYNTNFVLLIVAFAKIKAY